MYLFMTQRIASAATRRAGVPAASQARAGRTRPSGQANATAGRSLLALPEFFQDVAQEGSARGGGVPLP